MQQLWQTFCFSLTEFPDHDLNSIPEEIGYQSTVKDFKCTGTVVFISQNFRDFLFSQTNKWDQAILTAFTWPSVTQKLWFGHLHFWFWRRKLYSRVWDQWTWCQEANGTDGRPWKQIQEMIQVTLKALVWDNGKFFIYEKYTLVCKALWVKVAF